MYPKLPVLTCSFKTPEPDCSIVSASFSTNIPFTKNIKSSSVVPVIPVGAEAVTAVKCAVSPSTILAVCVNDFLKYANLLGTFNVVKYPFDAFSVTIAFALLSASVVSFYISFILVPFNPNEPDILVLPDTK